MMFSYRMSYYEVQLALVSFFQKKDTVASTNEAKCLFVSLRTPMLQDLLSLYPLSKELSSVLDECLKQYQQKDAILNFNVHSEVYQNIRQQVAKYLNDHYPSAIPAESFIEELELLIKAGLQRKDIQEQLIIAETQRYKERVLRYQQGKLKFLEQEHSLEEIMYDFDAYFSYLKASYAAKSSFAWAALGSLMTRLKSQEGWQEHDNSLHMLIRALDDARTSYHTFNKNEHLHFNYSCPQGLEETLLSHHAVLLPHKTASAGEPFVLSLTAPFVDTSGERRTFSQRLYKIYLEAAGYKIKFKKTKLDVLRAGTDVESLKTVYLAQFAGVKKLLKENEFKIILFQLRTSGISASLKNIELIDFLNKNQALQRKKIRVRTLSQRHPAPSEKEILEKMLEIGPFLDMGHLRDVLALSDLYASTRTMEEAARLQTEIDSQLQLAELTQKQMQASYDSYITNAYRNLQPFYYYYNPILQNIFLKDFQYNSSMWSQDAFITAFQKYKKNSVSRAYNRQSMLNICAIAGHAKAIEVFLATNELNKNESEAILPNILMNATYYGHIAVVKVVLTKLKKFDFYDAANGNNVLTAAAAYGYLDIIKLLFNAGVAFENRYYSAIINAAAHKHRDIVNFMIQCGANPDSSKNNKTPLIEAARLGDSQMILDLLDAGASINLRTGDGNTALISAACAGHQDTATLLLEKGAVIACSDLVLNILSIPWSMSYFLAVTMFQAVGPLNGVTPLMRACERRNLAHITKLLDAHPSSINQRSVEGYSAIDYAIQRNDKYIVKILSLSHKMTVFCRIKALQVAEEHNRVGLFLLIYKQELQPLLNKTYPGLVSCYHRYQKSEQQVKQTAIGYKGLLFSNTRSAPKTHASQKLIKKKG